LEPVWARLNAEELKVKQERNVTDRQLLSAQWGAGNVIGGPPRYYNGSGSFLSNDCIIRCVIEELNKQIGD
jgi:hypothetical protein